MRYIWLLLLGLGLFACAQHSSPSPSPSPASAPQVPTNLSTPTTPNSENLKDESFLIIGRHPIQGGLEALDTKGGKRKYLYGYQTNSEEKSVLNVDFFELKDIKTKLPESAFDGIVFGRSVSALVNDIDKALIYFHKSLKPGGKLFIDVANFGFQNFLGDNEKLLSCHGKKFFSTSSKVNYCLGPWDRGIHYERPRYGRELTEEEEREMTDTRLKLITEYLPTIFGGTCSFKTANYPVAEIKENYFECIK